MASDHERRAEFFTNYVVWDDDGDYSKAMKMREAQKPEVPGMTGQQRQERLRAATVALARLNTSILISNQTLAAELILNAADEAVPVVAAGDEQT